MQQAGKNNNFKNKTESKEMITTVNIQMGRIIGNSGRVTGGTNILATVFWRHSAYTKYVGFIAEHGRGNFNRRRDFLFAVKMPTYTKRLISFGYVTSKLNAFSGVNRSLEMERGNMRRYCFKILNDSVKIDRSVLVA